MEERKELKKKQDILLENVTNEISINKDSSIEELLIVLDVIINGSKIIENAKKVEELKSLFYLKLKEDIINSNEITKDKSTYEIDFKEKINLYKAMKKSIRDEILRNEKINLKIKTGLIDEIKDLIEKVDLNKETFDSIKIIQKKWRETGLVSIRERNNIWNLWNLIRLFHFICIRNKHSYENIKIVKNSLYG